MLVLPDGDISPDLLKAVSASHSLSWKPGLLSLYQMMSSPMQALADAKVSTGEIAAIEVIGGSSRVPALIKILKDFFGKEPSRTLNAKECVSRGCALNCAMLSPIFRCVVPAGWLVEGASLSPSGFNSSFEAWWLFASSVASLLCCLRCAWYISMCCCTPAIYFCWTGLHAKSCTIRWGLQAQ